MRRRPWTGCRRGSHPHQKAIPELWSALEADPETSFHQSRAWVEAWAKTTGANLNVVTLEHDGVPFAILPLEIEQRGGLSIARFAGTAHSNENTGLIDTKQLTKIGQVSAKQLAPALTKAGLSADLVLFDKMSAGDGGNRRFRAPAGVHPIEVSSCRSLPTSPRYWRRSTASAARRSSASPGATAGGDGRLPAHHRRQRCRSPAAAGCFSRAEAGAADRAGAAPRRFPDPGIRAFLRSLRPHATWTDSPRRTSRHRTCRRRSTRAGSFRWPG